MSIHILLAMSLALSVAVAQPPTVLQQAWSIQVNFDAVGAFGFMLSPPMLIGDGTGPYSAQVVATLCHNYTVLNADTGAILMNVQANDNNMCYDHLPIMAGSRLIAALPTGLTSWHFPSGTVEWENNTLTSQYSPTPTGMGFMLIVAAVNGNNSVVAVDYESGDAVWTASILEVNDNNTVAAPAVSVDVVCVAAQTKKWLPNVQKWQATIIMYGFALRDGKQLWRTVLDTNTDENYLTGIPIAHRGKCFVSREQSSTIDAVDLQTGEKLWAYVSPYNINWFGLAQQPAVTRGVLAISTIYETTNNNMSFIGLDTFTGLSLWDDASVLMNNFMSGPSAYECPAGPPPSNADGLVWVDSRDYAFGLDPFTGKELFRTPTSTDPNTESRNSAFPPAAIPWRTTGGVVLVTGYFDVGKQKAALHGYR